MSGAALLAAFACLEVVVSADDPLLAIRERLTSSKQQQCPSGMPGKDVSYSELRVFTSEQAEERTWRVTGCSSATDPRDWKAPGGSRLRKFRLAPNEYQRLKALLESPNVGSLGSFMNAGPGVGDYEVEIYRPSGVQRISVVALMPEHVELRRDPTLLRLICAAKQLSVVPQPSWCPR
jgi:hypothetical protein